MQKWLHGNDILIYWTHNDRKSVAAKSLIRTLKSIIYKKVKANNNSKSYHGCLNKSVDEYNNTYHCSIGKKPIRDDYSALT